MIKNKIQKLINSFGYEIKRLDKKNKNLNFDQILKKNTSKNPVIFDVGANKGQSITRFSNLFENPIIHSFEPLKEDFELLKTKYQKKNIYLNNIALGEKEELKEFNVATKTDSSSFYKINKNTEWIKVRSLQNNTTEDQYVKRTENVQVSTLDNYIKINNIEKIDLLKIDTECHEDKVLEGSLNTLKNKTVKIILIEIRFDNVYNKYFSFSDIEKFLIPNNFRMVGIDLLNNNLFSGLVFAADVMYFNKKYFKI